MDASSKYDRRIKMTVFSTNMKKYRVQSFLTQEQVAEKLKVNPQTVSRWECGTTMPDVLYDSGNEVV